MRTSRGGSSALLCALVMLVVLTVQPVVAEGEEKEAEEWAEKPHELGLFLGVTTKEGESGFSLGFDYEYRLNLKFGVGGTLEFTAADFRESIAAASFYYHPWRKLKLVAAAGVEIGRADGTKEFLVRLGGEYGFEVGRRYDVAPAFYLDLTSEDVAVVIGAAVARSF